MIGFDAQVGSVRFGGGQAAGQRQSGLVSLDTEVGAGGVGRCLLRIGSLDWSAVRMGDPVQVRLDAGDGAREVFRGEVSQFAQRVGELWVWADDGLARLARVDVESAYEEVSAGFIARDLIGQAGATVGTVEEGPTLPSYVVHRGPRALRHVERLAEFIGAELAGDGSGRVHVRRPRMSAAAGRLTWGVDLLALDLRWRAPVVDSFVLFGEGAAGTEGPERSHWLPTDLEGVRGAAGVRSGAPGRVGQVARGSGGMFARTLVEGAVRSAEAAGELAEARARLLALRPVAGHVVALGRPALQPGDWVDLRQLPGGGPGSAPGAQGGARLTLRARRVSHHLSTKRGLLTRLEF